MHDPIDIAAANVAAAHRIREIPMAESLDYGKAIRLISRMKYLAANDPFVARLARMIGDGHDVYETLAAFALCGNKMAAAVDDLVEQ